MRPRTLVPILILAAAAASLVRCGGDGAVAPPPPIPGTRTLVIASPNGAEGAALIEIDTTAVRGVSTDSGSVFIDRVGGKLRFVLVRASPGTLRLRIDLADTAAALSPSIIEVAGPDNRLRTLAGYAVQLSR